MYRNVRGYVRGYVRAGPRGYVREYVRIVGCNADHFVSIVWQQIGDFWLVSEPYPLVWVAGGFGSGGVCPNL